MSDPIKTIGQRLTAEAQRDAIHVAILPVICGDYLNAGQRVQFKPGSNKIVVAAPGADYHDNYLGVIDPFLKGPAMRDSLVWLFLKPGSVRGMRHHWVHPVIDATPVQPSASEKWLRRFAAEWQFDYNEMLAVATHPDAAGETWITAYGRDLHSREELGADYELFWQCIETLAGRKFGVAHREKVGWSCTC